MGIRVGLIELRTIVVIANDGLAPIELSYSERHRLMRDATKWEGKLFATVDV